MPELPDVVVYVESLERCVLGAVLSDVRLESMFLLRSVEPPVDALVGRAVTAVHRLGKRIVFAFEGDHYAVLHLMIAGRLRWRSPGAKLTGRATMAGFDFERDGAPLGRLVLTEQGSKKRARLHVVRGAAGRGSRS